MAAVSAVFLPGCHAVFYIVVVLTVTCTNSLANDDDENV